MLQKVSVSDEKIDDWTRRILDDLGNEVAAIIRRGQTYIEIKEVVGHGNFGKMFKDRGGPLPTTSSTAQRYARIANDEVFSNPANSRVLPPSVYILEKMLKLKAPHRQELIEAKIIHSDMTMEDAQALVEGKEPKPKQEPEPRSPFSTVSLTLLNLRDDLYNAEAEEIGAEESARRILEVTDTTMQSYIREPSILEDLDRKLDFCKELVAAMMEAVNAQPT
jgi:hypothetical protein